MPCAEPVRYNEMKNLCWHCNIIVYDTFIVVNRYEHLLLRIVQHSTCNVALPHSHSLSLCLTTNTIWRTTSIWGAMYPSGTELDDGNRIKVGTKQLSFSCFCVFFAVFFCSLSLSLSRVFCLSRACPFRFFGSVSSPFEVLVLRKFDRAPT